MISPSVTSRFPCRLKVWNPRLPTVNTGRNHRELISLPIRRSVEGFPDLVLVRPPAGGGGRGRVVFAELKVGRARPTVAQEAWLEGLRLAGQEAYVWWPEQEAEIVEVLRAGC